MKRSIRIPSVVLVFLAGYCAGVVGPQLVSPLRAQDGAGGLNDESSDNVRKAHQALTTAMSSLESDQRYATVTEGVNAFSVLSGGVNALSDLESGRGVDPETFAALYAGRATKEIGQELTWDEQGRLLFRGSIVRMYSRSRLARMFVERDKLATPGGGS